MKVLEKTRKNKQPTNVVATLDKASKKATVKESRNKASKLKHILIEDDRNDRDNKTKQQTRRQKKLKDNNDDEIESPSSYRQGSSKQGEVDNTRTKSIESNDKVRHIQAIKFQKEKESILSSIPKEVTNDFRQIGFAKWDGQYQYVLQLGPYDVCPGPVRELWMKMFSEKTKTKQSLSRLVYWYGAPLSEAFSLLPENKIIPLEKGVERSLDKSPKAIRKKLRNNEKLSPSEKLIVKNFKYGKKDSLLGPKQRSTWLSEFKESHEKSKEEDELELGSQATLISNDTLDSKDSSNGSVVSLYSDEDLDEDSSKENEKKRRSDTKPIKNAQTKKLKRQQVHEIDSMSSNDTFDSKNSLDGSFVSSSSDEDKDLDSSENKRKIRSNTKAKKTMGEKVEKDDTIDIRILVKPTQQAQKACVNSETKIYSLYVEQNGVVISNSELKLAPSDKSVNIVLRDQNVTFNLAFKL